MCPCACTQYCDLPNITIGGYDFVLDANYTPLPIGVHLKQYMVADLEPSRNTYVLDGRINESEHNSYLRRAAWYTHITLCWSLMQVTSVCHLSKICVPSKRSLMTDFSTGVYVHVPCTTYNLYANFKCI